MSESPDANWVGVVPHVEHREPSPFEREQSYHGQCRHLWDYGEELKPGDPLGRPIHVVCRLCGTPGTATVTT